MNKPTLAGIIACALSTSGCSTEGGGPLGLVALNPNQHVAGAEPLFGGGEDRCLDRPSFLLSIFEEPNGNAAAASRREDPVCAELRFAIREILLASFPPPPNTTSQQGLTGANATAGRHALPAQYSVRQRNEVIDALIAASNRKCGRYVHFLQGYDANINTSFGLLTLLFGGLAPLVRGDDTARTLGGLAAISGGARSTFNEAHFRNRTIAVLAVAFEHARAQQRETITSRQQCPVERYSLMRGLEDSFRYHASCSVVFGLDEAARAVERANSPDFETLRRATQQLSLWRRELQAAESGTGTGGAGTSAGATPPPAAAAGTGTQTTETESTTNTTTQTRDTAGNTSTTQTETRTESNQTIQGGGAAAPSCPFETAAPRSGQPQASNQSRPRTGAAARRLAPGQRAALVSAWGWRQFG